MAIFKKYILPPDLRQASQVTYNATLKTFFTDLNELMLSAGFVKSNTANNMDINNIPRFDITQSGTNYSPTYIEYDFNDNMQSITPIRIRIEFGTYRYSSSTTKYVPNNMIRTSVGLISASNELYNSAVFLTTQTIGSAQNQDGVSFWYNSNLLSSIIVTDDTIALSIIPEFVEHTSAVAQQYTYPIIEFICERTNIDTINVYARNGAASYINNTEITKQSIKVSSDYYVFNNSQTNFLTSGRLITWPVYNIVNSFELTQSKNIFLAYKDAAFTGSTIEVSVDGAPDSKFLALSANNNNVTSKSRLFVRYE